MASPRIMSAEDIPPEALSLQVAGVGFSDDILELLVNHALSTMRAPSNGNLLLDFAPANGLLEPSPPVPMLTDGLAEPFPPVPVLTDIGQSFSKQDYVKPDQWDTYRPIITDLYSRKPLREVRKEMASKYSFHASEKMFKYRIKLWGLDKKLKASDVRKLIRLRNQQATSKDSLQFLVRGKPVDWKRVGRYMKRHKMANHPGATIPANLIPMSTSIRAIDPPDEQKLYDMLSTIFTQYVEGSLESGRWYVESTEVGLDLLGPHGNDAYILMLDWVNLFLDADRLLGLNKINCGFAVLNHCLDMVQRLIEIEDPWLQIQMIWVVYIQGRDDIAKTISSFFRNITLKVLPARHPLTVIWEHWHKLQSLSMYRVVKQVWSSWMRRLCGHHPGLSNKLGPANIVAYYKALYTMAETEEEYENLEAELRAQTKTTQELYTTDNRYMTGKLLISLADIMIDTGQYSQAESMLSEVDDWLARNDGIDSIWSWPLRADWVLSHVYLFEQMEDWSSALKLCRERVEVLEDKLGRSDFAVRDIRLCIARCSRKLKAAEAEELEAAYEDVVLETSRMLCGSEESGSNTIEEQGEEETVCT